ncbi:MAG: aminotransferase class V-fold PLP-dependent enzyme [Desulfobacterales bacterium]|nr:aminotransferase class V-fold PLP-dependent enzyme [Desulfobacterales bacterium]
MKIPESGISGSEIFERLDACKKDDVDWASGRVFGYVFDPGAEILDFAKQVYNRFLTENALDFTVYPSLLRLENDLVAIMRTHLRGGDQVVGNFTSGGTESILLAVKAARDYYRRHRPEIENPEMILPSTAHAAFHKAAHYFGIRARTVSVNPGTFQADAKEIEKHITGNTIFMAGSAPTYTQGVIDPIAELSELARKNKIWFHTDACMGGFLLPYFRRLGCSVPDFDFSLPGVNSLSVDLHKYAYAPKGASVILYRDPGLRKFQMFAFSRWLGYTMINPTVQSTKSGGPLAAAWAVLHYVGDEKYLAFAEKKLEATRKIRQAIEAVPELYILGRPEMTLLSFSSDQVNIFHIIDEMRIRGWYIQPSFSYDNTPANIHLSVNLSNAGQTEEFAADLADSVENAKTLPSGALLAGVQEMMEKQGENMLDNVDALMSLAGMQDGKLPERTAAVNEVLDAMPPDWREKILLEVTNRFFHP